MSKSLDIIFENDKFIAVNKPAGLLTIPDRHHEEIPSLYKMLQKKYGEIFIVHRLDKETTGIILFAKNEGTHKYLSQLFENRNVKKFYTGIVKGSLQNKTGIIDAAVMEHPAIKGLMVVNQKGKASLTEYKVLEDFGFFSLVQFQIHTGRTHQIRVHMKHIGHPLACDDTYGNGKPVLVSSFKKKYKLSVNEENERPILSRLALHSSELIFKDEENTDHDLEATLPKDMKALIQQLRKFTGSVAPSED